MNQATHASRRHQATHTNKKGLTSHRSNVIMYKLYCKDRNIQDVCIGSTKRMGGRMNSLKNDCHNLTRHKHNVYVYKFVKNNGKMEKLGV